jgi:hypothetical protein
LVYFKDCLCSLILVNNSQVSKMTPPTPVINTPESLNSPVVNTMGSLSSLVVNTLGNLDFPVMNTPVSRLLGVLRTSTRTGLQKTFWRQTVQELRLPIVFITGESCLLMYLAQKQFQIFKIFTELFVFITSSLAKNTPGSLLDP